MSAQAITILSGVVLLIVFALAGWNVRRRRSGREKADQRESRP